VILLDNAAARAPMNPTSRSIVEGLLAQAKPLVPDGPSAPLPPMDGFPDIPQWHPFEHSLWSIGERIRQALNCQPKLRGDHSLYAKFLTIVQNRHAMRGRQSFVLLFAYRRCVAWATDLAALLPDPDIDGQITFALYKMRAAELILVRRLAEGNGGANNLPNAKPIVKGASRYAIR